ncbi:coxsackievirus and adenovirus receptor homolog [Pholidichthys leucotaenia]
METQQITRGKLGQTVVLPCRADINNPDKVTVAVEWKRADLKDDFVLLYRDDQFDEDSQHPSFKSRVELQNKQVKEGDVSLVLKNVSLTDSGTYRCEVLIQTAGQNPQTITNWKIVLSVQMEVKPGDEATLPCKAPTNKPVPVVDWVRHDLNPQCVKDNPHFMDRVEMKDGQDGDVSLTLKDVMTDDSGIYECSETNLREEPFSVIQLNVTEPGKPDEECKDGKCAVLAPAVTVVAVLVAIAIILLTRFINLNA